MEHASTSLNRGAATATTHCLTGCAIGEVLGFVIGTWRGWGDVETMVLAIVFAYCFGYAFTLVPLRRGGMALKAALGFAFALAVAWVAAFPVNRLLIARGLGHARVHAHMGHAS
jgi:Domain of unknown function (DUF4396)